MGFRDDLINAARATARMPPRAASVAAQGAGATDAGADTTQTAPRRTPKDQAEPAAEQQATARDALPLPADPRIASCRSMVTKKAMLAAGAAVIPVPGLDIAADIALLTRLLGQINAEFGLTQAQIDDLSPSKKALAFKAIQMVGSSVIGSALTRQLIVHVLRSVGVRMTTKQITKYVPIAGQALSAALAYSAMRHVCLKHIDDCARVAGQLALPAPARSKALESVTRLN